MTLSGGKFIVILVVKMALWSTKVAEISACKYKISRNLTLTHGPWLVRTRPTGIWVWENLQIFDMPEIYLQVPVNDL